MKRKVALVTGSNRGIGKSCIEDFARAGVNVVINYCHHEDEAEELEKYIKENYDVEVLTIKCDISKEEEVEQMVDEIIEVFGGIDILVNNASVARDSLLMDKNIKEFKRVLRLFDKVYIEKVFASERELKDIYKQAKINKIFNEFEKFNENVINEIDENMKEVWIFLGAGEVNKYINQILKEK